MRLAPTPEPTRVRPTRRVRRAARGVELFLGRRWGRCRAVAAAIAASGQVPTPASLPITPGGSLIEKLVNSCSPSLRVRRRLKGE